MSILSTFTQRRQREGSSPRPVEGRRRRVVVADDDPLVRRLIIAILGPRYSVIQVADGLSAVSITRNERPDLTILDYILPGLHGYEACRQIKADPLCANQKVILLTAYPEAGGGSRAREVGADDFLRKPFSPVTLRDAVERLIDV